MVQLRKKLIIKPSDIIISRIKRRYMSTLSRFITGNYLNTSAVYIGKNKIIEASNRKGVNIDSIDNYTGGKKYFHIYRLRDQLFPNISKKLLKTLIKYSSRKLRYGKKNTLGLVIFTLIRDKTKIPTTQFKDIYKPTLFYKPETTNCSQFLFRCIVENLDKKQENKLYSAIYPHDIRSFFPHLIPKISDYKFTVFPGTGERKKLSEQEMKVYNTKVYI